MRRLPFALVLMLLLVAAPVFSQDSLTVGIVVFEGFLTSEVTAPLEVFSKAKVKGATAFEVITIGVSKRVIVSEEGLRLTPDEDFESAPKIDILVVPSALDVEGIMTNEPVVQFIRDRAPRATWVASHCAGAFLLGKAGFLSGRRVTTYIGGAKDLQEKFPEAKVVDEHVVVDGHLVSSIGGVTSYDASLDLLERITDAELASKVAEALYYFSWTKKGRSSPTP
ncbi:MAG: DJ-1/PfpI family protein [Acidobacteriota bacterium]